MEENLGEEGLIVARLEDIIMRGDKDLDGDGHDGGDDGGLLEQRLHIFQETEDIAPVPVKHLGAVVAPDANVRQVGAVKDVLHGREAKIANHAHDAFILDGEARVASVQERPSRARTPWYLVEQDVGRVEVRVHDPVLRKESVHGHAHLHDDGEDGSLRKRRLGHVVVQIAVLLDHKQEGLTALRTKGEVYVWREKRAHAARHQFGGEFHDGVLGPDRPPTRELPVRIHSQESLVALFHVLDLDGDGDGVLVTDRLVAFDGPLEKKQDALFLLALVHFLERVARLDDVAKHASPETLLHCNGGAHDVEFIGAHVRLQFGNDLVKMRGGHLCFIVDKKKVWS